jgi:ADP-dependent NAD(P)H-hydrate dehydratase
VNSLTFDELPALPARAREGHKGSFGSVLVIGGCAHAPRTMLGGAMLAARAALRAGAGRVIAAVPAPLASEALVILPEATVVALPCDLSGVLIASEAAEAIDAALREANAIVVGPALGRSAAAEQVVMRLVALGEQPLVIDADAIRAFAAHREAVRDVRGTVVFTPHPGEASALAEALELEVDAVERATRPAAALALAQRLGAVVALKGHGTVTSDGLRAWRCDRGGAALATGGSGDVLAGVIGAFFAQFAARDSYGAARDSYGVALDSYGAARASYGATLAPGAITALAVDAHARAGDLWAARHGDAGALAREIADLIPEAMHAMRAGH